MHVYKGTNINMVHIFQLHSYKMMMTSTVLMDAIFKKIIILGKLFYKVHMNNEPFRYFIIKQF
jgi:hypothetical protein